MMLRLASMNAAVTSFPMSLRAAPDWRPGWASIVKVRFGETYRCFRQGLGAAVVAAHSSLGSEDTNEEITKPVEVVHSRTALEVKTGKILVVEDEGIVALDIRMTLRRLGHQVLATVDTGDDAVALAVNLKPDLILMDIRLKGTIDGIEATHQIQKLSSVPVIYLTGQLDESTVRRAQTTNPAGYIAKPFTASDLAGLIQQVLNRN